VSIFTHILSSRIMKQKSFTYNAENVLDCFTVVGIVHMENGCCKDQPVLITANILPNNETNYSCQCGCGMWCTTGHPTPVGALRDYQTMSNGNVPLEDDYPSKK